MDLPNDPAAPEGAAPDLRPRGLRRPPEADETRADSEWTGSHGGPLPAGGRAGPGAPDLERLRREWEPILQDLVRLYPLDEHERWDCTQSVWLVVTQSGPPREETPPAWVRAWLGALVRHKAIDLMRRRMRHLAGSLTPEVEGRLVGREEDPARAYERRRARRVVRAALDELRPHLPAPSYRVLYLRWVEGLKIPQIAAALGLTADQVRARHHRAFRRLHVLIRRRREDLMPE